MLIKKYQEWFMLVVIMSQNQSIRDECAHISVKRIMLKVKLGHGRPNKEFLAWCHALVIIVHLGVSNTTSALQDMDKSYGGFKTGFYASLDFIVEHCVRTANGPGQP